MVSFKRIAVAALAVTALSFTSATAKKDTTDCPGYCACQADCFTIYETDPPARFACLNRCEQIYQPDTACLCEKSVVADARRCHHTPA